EFSLLTLTRRFSLCRQFWLIIALKELLKRFDFEKMNPQIEVGWKVDDLEERKNSFKDVLLGSTKNSNFVGRGFGVEDIELGEGDIISESIGGISSIKLSERVYSFLEKSMERTVILILLDRKITINDDYIKALLEVLWVVFGHYLTVQPWSTSFLTNKAHPMRFMGWIRLLRLFGMLYKKSILKKISGTIGCVVKIDENTKNGMRGYVSKLAVTHLTRICRKIRVTEHYCTNRTFKHTFHTLS
ncbi:hypothetical protein Godav_019764, partial [Gossypium davidsonii]|nr:hypothetical protein [Gossypium davidsonii]